MTNTSNNLNVQRREIWWADLSGAIGSEQGGVRPIVVIQCNKGNEKAPTTIIAPITTKLKRNLKTHVILNDPGTGLSKNSVVLLEQIKTIDKSRLTDKVGSVNIDTMRRIEKAASICLGISFDNIEPYGKRYA